MMQTILIMFYLFQVLSVLISVAFVTLLERKILGFIQGRIGPNKTIFKGIFQSVGDAVKLLSKSGGYLGGVGMIEYNIMPMGMMVLMLGLWLIMPNFVSGSGLDLLLVLCIFSLGVYPIMFGGWFSGSYYSMLGSIRSVAQMISYEVNMIIIIISMSIYSGSFSMVDFNWFLLWVSQMFSGYIMFLLFFSFLIELNRTPIDLVEGESELVSGFNTEYYGFKFALIFLSEYGMIIFMSGLISLLGLSMPMGSILWCFFTMIFIYIFIWIRGFLPRIRYDVLMYMCWVMGLSLSVGSLTLILGYFMNF